MKYRFALFLSAAFILICSVAQASSLPRVDADIQTYDDHVSALNSAFNATPVNMNDKSWVEAKLQHMVDVDQYARLTWINLPFDHQYTDLEKQDFQNQFIPRLLAVDRANTADVKSLLLVYSWFTISAFNAQADYNGWLLVQHADLDSVFQRKVLSILTQLLPSRDTSPKDYAYLYDRAQFSPDHPELRQPQRYGTQGSCTGPGTWVPWQDEDPANLDQRRASVGLPPEADYIKGFVNLCH